MSPPPDSQQSLQSRIEARLLRMGAFGQLLGMLFKSGRWWMLPVLGTLLLLGIVLIAIRSVQYVAPFIYLVF